MSILDWFKPKRVPSKNVTYLKKKREELRKSGDKLRILETEVKLYQKRKLDGTS